MHERARGQKNPAQHFLGYKSLFGIIELSELTLGLATLAAHPASQLRGHEVELQFAFGGGVAAFAKFSK
jgi:hypothetical protein